MKKKILIISIAIIITISLVSLFSYAFYETLVDKTNNLKATGSVTSATMELEVDYTGNIASVFSNLAPLSDADGMQTNGFNFTIENTGSKRVYYKISLVEGTLANNQERINSLDLKLNLSSTTNPNIDSSYSLTELRDGIFFSTYIDENDTQAYTLRAWIDEDTNNDSMGKYFNGSLRVEAIAEPETYQIIKEFDEADLKEVIRCNQDKTNCSIYNTIEDAITASNNSLIILTDDIERTTIIQFGADKNVILDLNGHRIEKTTSNRVIDVVGNVTIKDTMGNGMVINSLLNDCGHGIATYGYLTIDGGTYITKGTCANFYIGGTGTGNDTGHLVVNKAILKTNSVNFRVYSGDSNAVIINDAIVINHTSKMISSYNTGTGDIIVNGGIFVAYKHSTFENTVGTLEINQTNKPIYISNIADLWIGAITNKSTGEAVISGSAANNCNRDPLNTTSGLCVYAGYSYQGATGNVAVYNSGTSISIDGGSYVADYISMNNNNNSSTFTIKNAYVYGKNSAVRNVSRGPINICNSSINSDIYEFHNNSTGTITYYNTTFTDGTSSPDSNKIYNPSGTISLSNSCN